MKSFFSSLLNFTSLFLTLLTVLLISSSCGVKGPPSYSEESAPFDYEGYYRNQLMPDEEFDALKKTKKPKKDTAEANDSEKAK